MKEDYPSFAQPAKFNKFWMIVGPRNTPTIRHYSKDEALAEATRLTRKEGQPFYIMQSISIVELASPPVTVTQL